MNKFIRRQWPFLVLAGIALAFFFGLQASEEVFAGTDLSDIRLAFYPYSSFTLSQLQSGVIPFWNPHLYAGTPY